MTACCGEAITVEVVIGAPADAVWRAITVAESRSRWWSYLDLDPHLGGHLTERWQDPHGQAKTTSGRVVEFRPPHLLRCTWRDDDWPAETEIESGLGPDGNRTEFRLGHSRWARLGAIRLDLRAAHAAGWRKHLADLRDHLEEAAI